MGRLETTTTTSCHFPGGAPSAELRTTITGPAGPTVWKDGRSDGDRCAIRRRRREARIIDHPNTIRGGGEYAHLH